MPGQEKVCYPVTYCPGAWKFFHGVIIRVGEKEKKEKYEGTSSAQMGVTCTVELRRQAKHWKSVKQPFPVPLWYFFGSGPYTSDPWI